MRTLCLAVTVVLMGACASGKDSPPPAAKIENQAVTVVGENYCLGCALKKEEGAAAQCSVYGHRHTLKVESAIGADGKPIPELVGESLHYLDNDKSAALVKGEEFHKKRVEVKGRLFGAERTLEVQEARAL